MIRLTLFGISATPVLTSEPNPPQNNKNDFKSYLEGKDLNEESWKQARNNLSKLRSAYNQNSDAFPMWVDTFVKECSKFKEYCEEAKVYIVDGYDSTKSKEKIIEIAIKLCTEREPVNIAMHLGGGGKNTGYQEEILSQKLGYNISYYRSYFKSNPKKEEKEGKNELAPNIMVYTPTLVTNPIGKKYKGAKNADFKQSRPLKVIKKFKKIDLLNVIGVALDSKRQPDYEVFLNTMEKPSKQQKEKLIRRYGRIMDGVFQCAIQHKKEEIVFALFGCESFSQLYKGNFFKDIWIPAFKERLEIWKKELKDSGVKKISLMGAKDTEYEEFNKYVPSKLKGHLYGLFPKFLLKLSQEVLNKMLILNAWDPHSVAGNGNFNDPSLDGWVGPSTAVSAISWPGSNPYLRNNNHKAYIFVKHPQGKSSLDSLSTPERRSHEWPLFLCCVGALLLPLAWVLLKKSNSLKKRKASNPHIDKKSEVK